MTVLYIIEEGTGGLLGTQMVGQEGVAHRIDTLAACLYGRMTIDDVARLDLGYAPRCHGMGSYPCRCERSIEKDETGLKVKGRFS